jgi:hypothetical protein
MPLMFGFQRLVRKAAEASLPAASNNTVMVLVSKEDIYRDNRGQTPILLLRKGQEVVPEDLTKLVQNGARPEQFRFQYKQNPSQNAMTFRASDLAQAFEQSRAASEGMSNPITTRENVQTVAPANPQRHSKKVLILEPDQKSIKRLIDCLFVCGFNLQRIQPVRIPAHLNWTLERHCPQVLIVDYALGGQQNGLTLLLQTLPSLKGVEEVILTLDPQSPLPMAEEVGLRKACDENGIKILYKPISRFGLHQLLSEGAPNPLQLSMPRKAMSVLNE